MRSWGPSRKNRHGATFPIRPLPGSVSERRTVAVRSELRGVTEWRDGRPETELNFKFYRQATNKIAGISDGTATFLDGFFGRLR
jgi:hypothetical protein